MVRPLPLNLKLNPALISKQAWQIALILEAQVDGYAAMAGPKKFLAMHPIMIIPKRGGIMMPFIIRGTVNDGMHASLGILYPLSNPKAIPPRVPITTTMNRGSTYCPIEYIGEGVGSNSL